MTDRGTKLSTHSTLRRSTSAQHVPRLLVVDPDANVRRVVIKILNQDGFRIDTAASGDEAVGLLAAHSYDVVLTEAKLPGTLAGMEVLAAVKQRQPAAEVILLTGSPIVTEAVRAVKAGAFDYVTKPIVTERLRAVVRAALAGTGARPLRKTATVSRLPVRGYQAIRSLGSGKFGTVLLVQKNGCQYAMKILTRAAGAAEDRESTQRFVREGEIIAKLKLPGVVRLHELGVGPAHPRPFIVMEYVDGPPLSALIAANSLTLAQRLDILRQIARTLAAVHQADILHRDIKPGNILLAAGNQVKICDFGTARLGDSSNLTLTNEVIGTPAYMAPEMFRGNSRSIDQRADIFSLGVVAYELLTGQLPFQATTFEQLITAIVKEKPVAPRELSPDLSPAVQQQVGRMLEKAPSRRYQRVSDVAADLEAILCGRGKLRRYLTRLFKRSPWR